MRESDLEGGGTVLLDKPMAAQDTRIMEAYSNISCPAGTLHGSGCCYVIPERGGIGVQPSQQPQNDQIPLCFGNTRLYGSGCYCFARFRSSG